MFLLDVKQVNTIYNNMSVLSDTCCMAEPTEKAVENSEYQYPDFKVGEFWYYWLRTPYDTSDQGVRYVAGDGNLYGDGAH